MATEFFNQIYDSPTNALLSSVTSVHFLGSSGRFLAVARERSSSLEPCFPMNGCVSPLLPHQLFSHAIVKCYMAFPFWNPHWSAHCSSAPLGGQTTFTPATQEYQLELLGNSCTSLPTWLGAAVQNSKHDIVLTRRRHNRRLQPGQHHGLLGCCFVRQ